VEEEASLGGGLAGVAAARGGRGATLRGGDRRFSGTGSGAGGGATSLGDGGLLSTTSTWSGSGRMADGAAMYSGDSRDNSNPRPTRWRARERSRARVRRERRMGGRRRRWVYLFYEGHTAQARAIEERAAPDLR